MAHGSEDALALLYDRHVSGIHAVALRLTGDRGIAEEVVQETFLALWNRAELYDPGLASLGTWLRAIARNRTLDKLRAAGRRPTLVPSGAVATTPTTRGSTGSDRRRWWSEGPRLGRGPEAAAEAADLRNTVGGALAAMPEAERTVIVLAYRDELTQQEIADRLGWPLGTVKTRTRRALARLRELLEAGDPPAVPAPRTRMTMDHADALELIEIAAAEPDGLERLMAGDTPEAAIVAGHLAGCPACVAELAVMRRVAAVAREVIAAEPDPALKERTLDFVRATGVPRGTATTEPEAPQLEAAPAAPAAPVPATRAAILVPDTKVTAASVQAAAPVPIRRRRSAFVAFAGIAAALLLVGVIGYGAGGGFTQHGEYDSEIAVLTESTMTALSLAGTGDAQVVALAPTTAGGAAQGTLALSTSSGELVMFARGLATPAAGAEYGCWVEVAGKRQRIGTMYAAGPGWTWSGMSQAVASLPAGATFGVSLVPAGAGAGVPVLTGSL